MTAYKEECQIVLPGKQNKAKEDQKNSLIQGPERVAKKRTPIWHLLQDLMTAWHTVPVLSELKIKNWFLLSCKVHYWGIDISSGLIWSVAQGISEPHWQQFAYIHQVSQVISLLDVRH